MTMIKPGIMATAKPETFFNGIGINEPEQVDALRDFLLFDRKIYLIFGFIVGLIAGRAI